MTVLLNDRFAIAGNHRRVIVTYVPGGFWAVKVRRRGDGWVAFAVPRLGNQSHPFDLAIGPDEQDVFLAALSWYDGATALKGLGQVVFAGHGNATQETPDREPTSPLAYCRTCYDGCGHDGTAGSQAGSCRHFGCQGTGAITDCPGVVYARQLRR